MSLLISESYANEKSPLWTKVGATLPFGIYSVNPGTIYQTIMCPGMKSTGLVSIVYLHDNAGGGSQYVRVITPDTDSFLVTMSQACASPEKIVWEVYRLA